ncbi:F0F1 ATP synthase subunit gamma [Agriterribacter sp.]|uniref:F0F1 ATP synthase subunit gamma n=1 Tax=Agriterribacter sp. TaxID=2821509 RepID=UPI002C77BE06|nr:F0F1 ATP synthase subunit gamma [Agriterribacter sp.]HRP57292.1 F0F1 ATP synthase subunit gamma [Agriterribacter sp.]
MEVSPEKIQRKIKQAGDLGSVVKMMKAIASSKISEYQQATKALDAFYRTLLLGMHAYLRHHPAAGITQYPGGIQEEGSAVFLLFGSDQGLVGPFNNTIVEFFKQSRPADIKRYKLWAIGDRVGFILKDQGIPVDITFPVPHSVENITAFVGNVLSAFDTIKDKEHIARIYAFFNRPGKFEGYTPVRRQILPIGKEWRARAIQVQWPSNHFPQIIGDHTEVFSTLFREYLFTSFYRACAFSLSSENTSRLNAMIRAENNIEEISEKLQMSYHQSRQDAIDTELFDVVAGFKFLSSS